MHKKTFCLIIFVHNLLACEHRQWWAQAELLYWTIRKNKTAIPLVTSASLADPLPGALNQPGSVLQLSSCSIQPKNHAGFRFLVGTSLNTCHISNLELSYLLLPHNRSCRSLTTSGEPGSPNLAVPLYDTTGVWSLHGIPGETVAVLPGPLFDEPGFFGKFTLCGSTKFQGAEILTVFELCTRDCFLLSASSGLAWMQFCEAMAFAGQTHTDANAVLAADFFNFNDRFITKNNFFGPLAGVRLELEHHAWKLQTFITGGIGFIQNHLITHGSSRTEAGNLFFLTSHAAEQKLNGGIFTQPSNSGSFKQYKVGGMLEGLIRCSYTVRSWSEFSVGYNIIFLANVARSADQIDRKINVTRMSLAEASRATVGIGAGPISFGQAAAAPQAFGDASPSPRCGTTNFWTQGLIAGLLLHF